MNERIKQLLSEAKIYDGYDSMTQAITTCPRDLKKFAELIVRECYLWAKENGGLGCEEDFEALKEHFGVEQ
jgi:hypothetical protein